jgi:hypothetical protein
MSTKRISTKGNNHMTKSRLAMLASSLLVALAVMAPAAAWAEMIVKPGH